MADVMRPVPFKELLQRIFAEFEQSQAIFDIPQQQFYRPAQQGAHTVWDEQTDTLVGPAAGPHTQLAQNIVASWLTGGRFMELKTVQKLDTLEIAKPCIDAEDECFNTEWSTEFTLTKAYDEYLKAWFALHLLECVFQEKPVGQAKSFIFNMSVGYDLAGIQSAPMQEYLANMLDASTHPKFAQYQQELQEFILATPWLKSIAGLSDLPQHISPKITSGVTLSTMHGCPPHEIEMICRYMLEERGIHTFVKLNPTLLGYARVRAILDQTGFNYVQLSEEAFAHDLQLVDAKTMLHRLVDLAKQQQIGFGVKLTNTLGTLNHKGRLPEKEMYMSGRALFPLSINVALELSREFNGQLPISYSGGANKFNIQAIFDTGIRPITMATELLKPGGYMRLSDCVKVLDAADSTPRASIDVAKLELLAEQALTDKFSQKEWRGNDAIRVKGQVPLSDCSVAPCVSACPISQDIPEYIRLVGEKKYSQALDVIYERNALPSITGHICDHECQYNCTRRDYEGAVNIREMKKIALAKGWDDYLKQWQQPKLDSNKASVAIIGAGPAGLSAGYFLARAGHSVTIFEKESCAGGVVNNIIPQFRIPRETIEHDIKFVEQHGVNIEYGCDPQLNIAKLKDSGYPYICLGIGADKGNPFNLAGDNANRFKSLEFLRKFNDGELPALGKHVVVVGAGNTAMDSARAALRVDGVEKVTVLYRRSEAEMPAHRGEYLLAVADGIEFKFLCNPEQFNADGQLTARVMQLGEPDEKGRRRPVATDETIVLQADALVTAIGEQTNCDTLTRLGLPMAADGWPEIDKASGETAVEGVFLLGDANSGPSSIVSAIETARKASAAILQRENSALQTRSFSSEVSRAEIYQRKGNIDIQVLEPENLSRNQYQDFAQQEAQRCLECSYVCSKCVDVCPNRANIALPIPGFKESHQVLHLDAYCNECGNCGQFCPWESKPYQDKFTIFSLREDFESSTNQGFLVEQQQVSLRAKGENYRFELNQQGELELPEELTTESHIINYVLKQRAYLLGRVEL